MATPPEEIAHWLTAARDGSAEALGQALEACRAYLLMVAHKEIDPGLQAKGGASDLVQDTFLEAHRDFAQFQGTSEGELLAWLRQMLLYNAANFARHYRGTDKRRVDREVGFQAGDSSRELEPGFYAAGPSPSRQAMANEEAEQLQKVLERLPEDYRQVILLRYQDERTFEEISAVMGRTLNAVRKLWLRAMERLQLEWGEKP